MISIYLNDWVIELPVVVPPSRPLITHPSCLVAALAGCHITSRRPLVAPPSCRLITPAVVVASPLVAPPSPLPLTAPPSRCLIAPAVCCVASRCAALLLSSRHIALSPSYADWLLCCVFFLPSSRPLVLLPSRPLVASRLVVAWPPSNDAAAIECPRHRRSR